MSARGAFWPRRRYLLTAGLLAMLGLAALGYYNWGEPAADWRGWALESRDGLSFAIPPGRVVELGITSIDLVNPAAHRTADVIALYPEGPPPAITIGEGPVLQEGVTPAPFTLRQNAGGSGGASYTLSTSKIVDGRSIAMLAIMQSEYGTPSFADAWAVWESLRLAE